MELCLIVVHLCVHHTGEFLTGFQLVNTKEPYMGTGYNIQDVDCKLTKISPVPTRENKIKTAKDYRNSSGFRKQYVFN